MKDNIKLLGTFMCAILIAVMACVAAAFFWIPSIVEYSTTFFGAYRQSMVFMYVGAAALLWLLMELFLIMRTVRGGSPFVERNVRALRRIAGACALAEADFIFILFWSPRITLVICAVIVAIGTLCALVLSGVFARAVEYKHELDYTV